ncbi:MAG: uroporphyrinogen-III synthase [Roseiarcus sp.]|jgi:uroporphyrinogen-III synthase
MATPIHESSFAAAGGRAPGFRVAVMRPLAEAERSAVLLRAHGFEPVLAPAAEVRPTGAEPPDAAFDALLATSANAFVFLSQPARARLSGLKIYVAGARTAAAARAAGLGEADGIGEDAASLARLIVAGLAGPSRLLYLAARDRKSELESALAAAGHMVVATEIYRAAAREAWSAAEAAGFASCGAALHYSRRSAELTAGLAERAGRGDRLREMLNACLSQDTAEPLRSIGARRIVIASGAQESLLMAALAAATPTTRSQS